MGFWSLRYRFDSYHLRLLLSADSVARVNGSALSSFTIIGNSVLVSGSITSSVGFAAPHLLSIPKVAGTPEVSWMVKLRGWKSHTCSGSAVGKREPFVRARSLVRVQPGAPDARSHLAM